MDTPATTRTQDTPYHHGYYHYHHFAPTANNLLRETKYTFGCLAATAATAGAQLCDNGLKPRCLLPEFNKTL